MKDLSAAIEYARRYRKGLPSDRWTDGVHGAEAVARGIEEMYGMVACLWAEKQRAGLEAMEPLADPCRERKHEGDAGK